MPKSNQPSRRLWPSYVFFAATVACLCVMSGCGHTSGTNSGPPPNLVVTPSLTSLPSGWTQQFSANISGAYSTAVSWAVNGTIGGSPSTGTISASGIYTAPQVPPVPATVKISAVSQTDSSLIGSVSLKVTGLFAYVTEQSEGRLSAYRVGATGTLISLDNSPFVTGKTPFFLVANAHGKNLYVTDMNASDIYTYAIDERSGALTQVGLPVTVGSGPRAIAIHPSGTALYVACMDGAGIYGFTIDATSGAVTALPGSPFRNLGSRPAAITFDPSGKYAFVPNNASRDVSVLSVDLFTGKLTPIVQLRPALLLFGRALMHRVITSTF
jgi:6-phosphogluconolactonase (cycloisomerase 2 family)